MIRAALTALIALAVLAPGADAAVKRCSFKGTKTIAENRDVRVYVRARDWGDIRYGACRKANGRRFTLEEYEEGMGGFVDDVDLVGPVVGYSSTWHMKAEEGGFNVNVLDTRRNKSSTFWASQDTQFGLSGTGTLVWSHEGMEAITTIGISRLPAVRAARAGEAERKLDEGDGVDVSSLAVGRTRAYWTHAGEMRSAPLP